MSDSLYIIETERLALRQLVAEDFDSLRTILQDEAAMYAYEGAFSDAEVQAWLDKMLWRYAVDGFALWAVILKATGEFIGLCGITMQEYAGDRVHEVGYLFRRDFWHHGYATEAARACKEYAFNHLGAERVYSIIRDTNRASRNVALRNGMVKIDSIIKNYRGVTMPHDVFCAVR